MAFEEFFNDTDPLQQLTLNSIIGGLLGGPPGALIGGGLTLGGNFLEGLKKNPPGIGVSQAGQQFGQQLENAVPGQNFSQPATTEDDPLGLNEAIRGLLTSEQEAFTGAQQQDTANRENVIGDLSGVIASLNESDRRNQELIKQAQDAFNARLDPILSQFSTLFSTPAIDAATQNKLTQNIRGTSAGALEAQQEALRNTFAARGLSGSSLEGRELSEAIGQSAATRTSGENQLAGIIAELNNQRQIAGAQGGLGAASVAGNFDINALGNAIRSRLTTDQLTTGLQGGIADINLGKDFTPFSEVPYFALQQGQDFQDFIKQSLDEQTQETDNDFGILLDALGPAVISALLNELGFSDLFAGVNS